MKRLLQVSLVFMLSLLFVSSVFAEDLGASDESTFELSFNWIAFHSEGKTIAKVTNKCEIVIETKKKIGIHVRAELERYKGICEDMKDIEKEEK